MKYFTILRIPNTDNGETAPWPPTQQARSQKEANAQAKRAFDPISPAPTSPTSHIRIFAKKGPFDTTSISAMRKRAVYSTLLSFRF